MSEKTQLTNSKPISVGMFLLLSAVFGIAFTQWPLYSENQHTKFLHGLAAAGYGLLGDDWLANTVDPLPAFSFIVRATYSLLVEPVFYIYHALLLGVYLYSIVGIASYVYPRLRDTGPRAVFITVVIAMHASLLPPFSSTVLGVSLGWLLQAGVANQYLFNPVLQPSTFGVLLALSIYVFLRGHPCLAAFIAALAAVFHSTYLPSAAVLTLAYALISFWDQRRQGKSLAKASGSALLVGMMALAVVLPVLLYNAIAFAPTSVEAWNRSQDIIVNFRIPHHSLPKVWIDNTTYAKIGIVLVALILVRNNRLFPIMLLAFLTALVLTIVEMITDYDTLAFIAPWRISAFLVPLASSILLASIVSALFTRFRSWIERYRWLILGVSAIILVVLVARGAMAIRSSFESLRDDYRAAMMRFVEETKSPGQVYLIPTYMAEFRLRTGAPILVTFKSHPYKDVEVIDWWARVGAANDFYHEPTCAKLNDLSNRYDITHVVLESGQLESGCSETEERYRDDSFRVLEVTSGSGKESKEGGD